MDLAINSSLTLTNGTKNSITSELVLDSIKEQDDDTQWSWHLLRNEIKQKLYKELYFNYQERINNSAFVLLLLICIEYSSLNILIAIEGSKLDYSFKVLYIPAACIIVYVSMLIATYKEIIFTCCRYYTLICTILIYVCLLIEEYGSMLADCFHYQRKCCPYRLGSGLYLTLLIYLIVPVNRKYYKIIAALIVLLLELFISVWLLNIPFLEILPDVFLYLFANGYGIGRLFLEELTQMRVFLDLRNHVQSMLELQSQKNEQELLMLSIMPKEISTKVKIVLKEILKDLVTYSHIERKPFYDLFVEKHANVSILFADIVKFTPLTQRLSPYELVETLNDLFGKFDDAAKKNKCMRIKILGDCYYCVSGIPKQSDHANCCIKMGFNMISIIREIRYQRQVQELDMRIGVNSGQVISGILGLKKWHYDIWSEDVELANHLESTGSPGRIHISEATKDELGDAYTYEINFPQNSTLQTYLIVSPESTNQTYEQNGERRFSMHANRYRKTSIVTTRKLRKGSNEFHLKDRRPTLLETSIEKYQEIQKETILNMKDAIEAMALSKREQWITQSDINPFFLTLKLQAQEISFLKEKDPLFKYYLLCTFILFSFLIIVGCIYCFPIRNSPGLIIYTVIFLFIFFLVLKLAWFKHLCQIWKGKLFNPDTSNIHIMWKNIYKLSENITSNYLYRNLICIGIFLGNIIWISIANAETYNETSNEVANKTNIEFFNYSCADMQEICTKETATIFCYPRFIMYTVIISMMMISFFVRIHYLLKFFLNGLLLALFIVLICSMWIQLPLFWESRFVRDINDENWRLNYIDQILFIIQIFVLLHLSDRQGEYFSCLGYLWKCKLKNEQNDLAYLELVNRVLLHNILPAHVAKIYLKRMKESNELYHEQYDNVAVMFASIPNFMSIFAECKGTSIEMNFMQLLNEIICAFDELLFETRFCRIEKIKLMGSTYIAAAGLDMGRRSSQSNDEDEPLNRDLNIVMLTEFAIAMMEQLKIFNDDALQNYQLRIGIDFGHVIAGVVGGKKPLYDIWGNTVNMASRLDTRGETGKIQVRKETAKILTMNNFRCKFRAKMQIKGFAQRIETFFVCTPYDEDTDL